MRSWIAASSVSSSSAPSRAGTTSSMSMGSPSASLIVRRVPSVPVSRLSWEYSRPERPWPSTPTVPSTWDASIPRGYLRCSAGASAIPARRSLRIRSAFVAGTARAR